VIVCKVIGNAVSTIKDKRLAGQTMLLVGRLGTDPGVVLDQFVALDAVGAGEGEIVGVIEGTPAQKAVSREDLPIDAVVVAIFDSLTIKGKEVYKK
jgi:ethanolamine utilization protein EutN